VPTRSRRCHEERSGLGLRRRSPPCSPKECCARGWLRRRPRRRAPPSPTSGRSPTRRSRPTSAARSGSATCRCGSTRARAGRSTPSSPRPSASGGCSCWAMPPTGTRRRAGWGSRAPFTTPRTSAGSWLRCCEVSLFCAPRHLSGERGPVDERNCQRSLENAVNYFGIVDALGVSPARTADANMAALFRLRSGSARGPRAPLRRPAWHVGAVDGVLGAKRISSRDRS
jgi:hypothetical protein